MDRVLRLIQSIVIAFFLFLSAIPCLADTAAYDYLTGAGTNKFAYEKKGEASNIPATGPDISGQTVITSYPAIESANDVRYNTTDTANNKSVAQNFKFIIAQSTKTMSNIYVEWEGYGYYSTTYGAYFYIRNFGNNTWEAVGNHANSTDQALTNNFSSNFGTYISTNNYLYLAVSSIKATGGNKATLMTDYVKVIITYVDDVTAPGAITTLSGLKGTNSGEVRLSWVAPGDDNRTGTLGAGSKFHISTTTVYNNAISQSYWNGRGTTTLADVQLSTSAVNPNTIQSYLLSGLKIKTTYYIRIWTKDDYGLWSTISNGTTVQAQAPAPQNVTLLSVSSSSIRAGWGRQNAADEYKLQVSTKSVFSPLFASSNTTVVYITSLTVTGLLPNTTYYLRVGHRYDTYTRWMTAPVYYSTATRSNIPGTASPAFTAVFPSSITVQWTAGIPGNPSGTRYVVNCSSIAFGGQVFSSSTTFATSAVLTALPSNLTWYFQVKARNNNGVDTAYTSIGSTHTLCKVPSALAFSSVNSASIGLGWNANTNSDSTVYELWASTYNSGSYGILYSGKNINCTHTSLTPNVTYYYKIRAKNLDNVYSDYASQITTHTVCNIPASLSYSAVNPTSIGLSWSPNSNSGSTLYEVAASSCTSNSYLTVYTGKNNVYTHSSLTPNVTYYYKVRAKNLDNVYTDFSSPVTTHTACNIPGTPDFVSIKTNQIHLNWNPDNNSGSTFYELTSSTNNVNWQLKLFAKATFYIDSPLDRNTTSWYKVRAKNLDLVYSDYAALKATSTLCDIPAALPITDVGVTSTTLHWQTGNNPYWTSYLLECSSMSVGGKVFLSSVTLNSSALFTELFAHTTYYYRVKALNNNKIATGWANLGSTTTVPAQVTGISASAGVYTAKTRITWDAQAGCKYRAHIQV
ncbi:MAG: fibronectin type III domain-containing protein [Elusimicrobia bacterium]|nr:fibronectin type III domain-containing protein [Candidatus Liberimonas magnetica]